MVRSAIYDFFDTALAEFQKLAFGNLRTASHLFDMHPGIESGAVPAVTCG
jgi:hypothetical protein